jgi:hypothetical protein
MAGFSRIPDKFLHRSLNTGERNERGVNSHVIRRVPGRFNKQPERPLGGLHVQGGTKTNALYRQPTTALTP